MERKPGTRDAPRVDTVVLAGPSDRSGSPPDHRAARDVDRRRFLQAVGWGGLTVFFASTVPGMIRFFRPLASRGERDFVEMGTPRDHRTATVVTRWAERHGVWLVRRDGRLFALEARCTHLGCAPRWIPEQGVFRCPCHGSRFTSEGTAVNGPATRPLRRLAIGLEHDQIVVDRSQKTTMEEAERNPRFFIRI